MYYVGVRVRSQGQGWLRGFALVGGDGAGMQNADTTLLGSSKIWASYPIHSRVSLRIYLTPLLVFETGTPP